VEQNHIGGRNNVIWITAPFCLKHHNEFHLRLRLADIDLRYTSDKQERFHRARQATLIFLLMLEECAKESIAEQNSTKAKREKCKKCTTRKKGGRSECHTAIQKTNADGNENIASSEMKRGENNV
jgi:hypothetical protein